jgi:hypothetical protein
MLPKSGRAYFFWSNPIHQKIDPEYFATYLAVNSHPLQSLKWSDYKKLSADKKSCSIGI